MHTPSNTYFAYIYVIVDSAGQLNKQHSKGQEVNLTKHVHERWCCEDDDDGTIKFDKQKECFHNIIIHLINLKSLHLYAIYKDIYTYMYIGTFISFHRPQDNIHTFLELTFLLIKRCFSLLYVLLTSFLQLYSIISLNIYTI